MKIISRNDLRNTEREVACPNGGFVSYRFILEKDKMGFTVTQTFIPKGKPQHWHYKNHLEACLCISGYGLITDLETYKQHEIKPGVMYALDKNDDHIFQAIEDTVLVCVFNPPLKGGEVHGADGAYEI